MLNAVTPSWRWILLIAVGVLCTTINTVDVHRPVMSQEDLDLLRTDGKPDTKTEGEAAAKRDIARNARRYMTHGLGRVSDVKDLGVYKISVENGGCVTPDVGSAFWHGYNEVIRSEAQQRFGLKSAVYRENFGAAAAARNTRYVSTLLM